MSDIRHAIDEDTLNEAVSTAKDLMEASEGEDGEEVNAALLKKGGKWIDHLVKAAQELKEDRDKLVRQLGIKYRVKVTDEDGKEATGVVFYPADMEGEPLAFWEKLCALQDIMDDAFNTLLNKNRIVSAPELEEAVIKDFCAAFGIREDIAETREEAENAG